ELATDVQAAINQGGLAAPQFDAVVRQINEFHDAGLELPPVLESIRLAHERLEATQKVAAITAKNYAVTLSNIKQLEMGTDGSVRAAGATSLAGFVSAGRGMGVPGGNKAALG